MSEISLTCPSCGAHVPPGEPACLLCGHPMPGHADQDEATDEASLPTAADVYEDLPEPAKVVEESDVKPDEAAKPAGMGPIVLLAGILLIVSLYLISSVSGSKEPETPVSATQNQELPAPEVEPLAEELVEQVAVIQEQADRLSGTQRLDKLRELSGLYQTEGRFDLAGDTQLAIAENSGMEVDWIRAGNLYYDWMERREGYAKTYYAKKAITAYQSALEINPGNLDVRTDMAVAYLFDPDNPMQAIINTNQVLQADSTHLQANFNRGIMLMQINRMDDAVEQFKKVLRLAPDPNHPVNQRAAEAIRLLESQSGDTAP